MKNLQIDHIKKCKKCGKPGIRTLSFFDGRISVKHVRRRSKPDYGVNPEFTHYNICVISEGAPLR